ncbi:MAG: PAS domain S-box protein [Candidatus Nanopelagicales bacterium]
MTTTAGARPDASPGPDAITYEFDRHGVFTAVSDAFCDVLGWRREELLGTFAPSLVHPEDRGRLVEQGPGFYDGGQFDPVWRVRHASGDYRWYHVAAQQTTDAEGEVLGGYAVLEDVDQAEAARDALVDSERRYRLLVQNSHDVVVHQVAGIVRWISPSVTALTGWAPEEIVGRPSLHLWHPEDQETALQIRQEATHGPVTSALLRLQRKDGSYVTVDVGVHGDGDFDHPGVVVTIRDATERLAVLQRLQARESEFRLIAENAGDMVALSTLDGHLEWVSPSIERLLGVAPEEALHGRSTRFIHPDDVPLRDAAFATVATGASSYYEGRFLRSDGQYVWLGVQMRPVRDEAGTVVARIGVSREISAEVTARQALEDREAEYRTLAENAADVVFRLDEHDRFSWLSPSVESVLGYDPREMLGRDPVDYMHPDDLNPRQVAIEGAVGGRTSYEARYRHADGTYRWLAVSGHPVLDADGREVGRVGNAREIGSEVEAREALGRSQAMFRLLAENSADVVVCSDLRGFVEWASPSIEAVLGWSPEEMLGRNFAELIHPDELGARDLARGVVATGSSSVFLARYRHKDDRWVWLSVTVAPMFDADGQIVGVVGSGRDATLEVTARRALEASEANFRLLAENAADIVFRADPGMVIEWVSPSVHSALGWSQQDLLGHRITEWVHPDDLATILAGNQQQAASAVTVYDGRFRSADGSYRWFNVVVQSLRDADGNVVARVGSARDISEAVAAHEALETSEEMFRSVMDSSTIGMAVVGLDQRFRAVNPALCRLVDRDEQWFAEHLATELAPLENQERAAGDPLDYFRDGSRAFLDTIRLMRADGSEVWARRTSVVVRDADGEPAYLVAQIQDISAELENEYTKFHDGLTGLRNRQWIVDILEEELRTARRSGSDVGVLFIDLDNFKVVNDSLGHAAGDEVLATVAQRLTSSMRPGDHVGRFGGDEFVVVIPEIDEVPDLERICERVLENIAMQVDLQGHRITPTASIGVAISTLDSSAQSLLRDADSALYRAKSAGKQRWHFADEAMHAQAVARLTTEDELRRALVEHELVVHYQPIVRLSDRVVVGHEALVRWQHPTRGLVPPLDFLPVAEESGLIVDIGDEVLRLVCEMLVARPDLANVSVNLSPVQTSRAWWREKLVAQLNDLAVDPRRLSVEVTETAVLSKVDDVARELASLRSLGIGVHLDDFGTGYSSIALLRDLPITGLKLDMSFTRRLTGDGGTTEVLADGLARLANGLGMLGIAEGVETEEQAALLASMGWSHGQGWLFGRPTPDPA